MTNCHALIIDNSKTSQAITTYLLKELGVSYIAVNNEAEAWPYLESPEKPFSFILVSRQALPIVFTGWVARLRQLSDFDSTPVLLLVDGKAQQDKMNSIYDSGFTQVFCRQELELLETYIKQIQARDTFSETHHNKAVIIEDDLVQQLLVKSMLEDNQCECFCFTSAEEALAHAQEINPHVILCDFFLEGVMTGLDMVLNCRAEEHPWAQVPILVMTSTDDSARKVELVRLGANDYLTKPLDPIDVAIRVENLIRYKHLLEKVESQRSQMQYLAMHDQLTGLYNRYFVAEQVDLIVAETARYGNDCSIIVMDIDHFKKINDTYGHDVGDKVLIAIGHLLKQHSRSSDISARLGGEEFMLILKNCDRDKALVKAEFLRGQIETLCPEGLTVTASLGVAEFVEEHKSFESLFKEADQAVYKAKNAGRNRVESFNFAH